MLYARVGVQHCHRCGQLVEGQTAQQIARELVSAKEGTRIALLAPLLVNRKGEHRELLAETRRAGFVRLRVNGEYVETEQVESRAIPIEEFMYRFRSSGSFRSLNLHLYRVPQQDQRRRTATGATSSAASWLSGTRRETSWMTTRALSCSRTRCCL